MNFALLGTGFISESYLNTVDLHPEIKCAGIYDRDPSRSRLVGSHFGVPVYDSMAELLSDATVPLVINLTNPRDHYTTTRECLLAGKHVYSEKPLAMVPEEALSLVDLAKDKGVSLGTAPCSVLSPCAQTLWKAVREGRIGPVRMVYANFDDGMIAPHEAPWTWANSLGIPWPAKDEFEVGCTFEHAGYFLTWLCTLFGRVESMTAFASTQIEEKGIPVDSMAPDFTCGLLQFANGVVARATCGLVAPKDKSLTIIGDAGVLTVKSLRDDYGTVWLEPRELPRSKARIQGVIRRLQRLLPKVMPRRLRTPVSLSNRVPLRPGGPLPELPVGGDKRADFLRGPAEMALAIQENRPCRLPGELGAHIVEIIDQLHAPGNRPVPLKTFIPALEALPLS